MREVRVLCPGAAILLFAVTLPAYADTQLIGQAQVFNAFSTVAQRHMVRLQPLNHAPVLLAAVENDGYTEQTACNPLPPSCHYGLLWYRSDNDGASWYFYKDLFAGRIEVYDASRSPSTLHLTTDLIAVGNDIAAVYSYDTTSQAFPADVWDDRRDVYFQWWRYDGVNSWNPDPLVTIAPGSGALSQAYHRAEIARDSLGRLWVQAFLRTGGCDPGVQCPGGDALKIWVSTDNGLNFANQPDLATLPNQLGGGRLISVGSKLLMLWNSYDGAAPAQLRTRNDGDALGTWSTAVNAFPDGAHIYHGAALNAVADGTGGLHLVYKESDAQLYYRRYTGGAFGGKQAIDAAGDWILQPAITAVGTDLYVCINHVNTPNTDYPMRLYKLSAGWSTYQVLDSSVSVKAYPTAPEVVPTKTSFIPCGFAVGDPGGSGTAVVYATRETVTRPSNDIALLTDPWPGPNLGPLWTAWVDSAGSSYGVGAGVLTLTLEPNTGAAGAHVASVGSYSLLGSQITIKVPSGSDKYRPGEQRVLPGGKCRRRRVQRHRLRIRYWHAVFTLRRGWFGDGPVYDKLRFQPVALPMVASAGIGWDHLLGYLRWDHLESMFNKRFEQRNHLSARSRQGSVRFQGVEHGKS